MRVTSETYREVQVGHPDVVLDLVVGDEDVVGIRMVERRIAPRAVEVQVDVEGLKQAALFDNRGINRLSIMDVCQGWAFFEDSDQTRTTGPN